MAARGVNPDGTAQALLADDTRCHARTDIEKIPELRYHIDMLLAEIQKIIQDRNIRQKEICEALEISQSYMSELLSGKKQFSLDLLERLCRFLKMEIRLVENNPSCKNSAKSDGSDRRFIP